MNKQLARWLPASALGLALATSTAFAGFQVQGGKLVEGNGTPFVMRGVSHAHVWYTGTTQQALRDIASTGANTVRFVISDGHHSGSRTNGADLSQLIQWSKENKLIAVLEVHDATGFGDDASAEDPLAVTNYWLSSDVRQAINGQEDYVIINPANEPIGNNKAGDWTGMQKQTVQRLRDGGIKHTLLLDAPNWGQDWSNTMRNNAQQVFDADQDRNTVFAVHMYESYGSASVVQGYYQDFKNKNLPLVVGEFGADHKGAAVDEDAIMAGAQQHGFGYLGWSWSGNNAETKSLDITNSFNVNSLSSWGNRLINGANGIKQTAKRATIYCTTNCGTSSSSAASQGAQNIALNKSATATTTEGAGFEAGKAFDGNGATRWASALTASETTNLTVDLGGYYDVTGMKLSWEAAYAKGYAIEISSDNANWSDILVKNNSTGGTENLSLSGQGRYVRIHTISKANTAWGYSLWEVEVYGSPFNPPLSSSAAPSSTPLPSSTPSSIGSSSSINSTTNVALGKMANASAVEGAGFEAGKAFDGNLTTRWASGLQDTTATLTVNLGVLYNISGLKLNWEAAYAKDYTIQVSNDGVNFSNIYSKTGGTGGTETISATGQGRYVRINMTAKGTTWGYSLWEVAVMGTPYTGDNSSSTSSAIPLTNVALGKVLSASTVDMAGHEASMANDGNTTTRWSSDYNDANWLSVDLGANYSVSKVKLSWEVAYGKSYQIQTSLDAMNWTTVYTTAAGAGGTENLNVTTSTARFVRMNGITRATQYGYSLWEFEVYGYKVGDSSLSSRASSSSVPSDCGLNPSDTQATPQVKNLLCYLKTHTYISGQTDLADGDYVKSMTGRYPAMIAFDFYNYTDGYNIGSTAETQRAIDWAKSTKGIVAFQWHWKCPRGGGKFDGNCDFDQDLNNPSSALYQNIDLVVKEIKKMGDAGVPVLFRPLHEANNNYMWWAKKGQDNYKKLWVLIYNRAQLAGAHNIIWVFNGMANGQNTSLASWYPGDQYADVVSSDYFQNFNDFNTCKAIGNNKVMAVAETFNQLNPAKDPAWNFSVVWASRDWSGKGAEQSWKDAMANPKTIAIDQLPNFYQVATSSSRPASVIPTSTPTTSRSALSSSIPLLLSSSSVSSAVPSSRAVPSSSSVRSSSPVQPRLDNPFVGAVWYVDPIWSAKAMAETNGSKVAGFSTAVWMDRIGAISPTESGTMGLREHLDAAINQGANLIQVVIYDLPNRDCNALASNGELLIAQDGFNRYKNEYIKPIVQIFSDAKYNSLRIIAIIEPDSLPNLVTNTAVPKCQQSAGAGGYVEATQFTLNALYPLTNVYSYVDIGHSGWLGWDDNFNKATTFIGDAIKGTTNGVQSVAGFISNTANTTPLKEPFLDALANSNVGGAQVKSAKFFEFNPYFSELAFVQAWRNRMVSLGFPSNIGMLVDTSRNGWGGANRPKAVSTSGDLNTFVNQSRIDRRTHRGMWCNQSSGIGERPTAAPEPGVDAYVWIKPPGESDGVATAGIIDPTDPAKGFDRFCDPTYVVPASGVPTGAMAGAPHAGRWFSEGFKVLLNNAYPPLQ